MNLDTNSLHKPIENLLSRMTLAEKIGQMTQVEKNSITPDDVTEYAIGSILSGGGGSPPENTPIAWAAMVKAYQQAALATNLRIPLIYGVDAVHGHNNVHGAVIFPHNIGLGATRDPLLLREIGKITATEMLATNIHWTFAPTVAVPQDIRWGRTYEGFSENPDLVGELAAGYINGLQADVDQNGKLRALACAKHFVADGGTGWNTTKRLNWVGWWWMDLGKEWRIDQGDAAIDEAILRAIHLPPYQAAVEAGALSIMVSYSSWNAVKMHANKYLLTDVLKGELEFTGFLVSDYLGIDQIDPNYHTCVVEAINAGLDMVMVPFDYRRFTRMLEYAVKNGDIPIERVDDAVRRILTVKFKLGLFEQPYGDKSLLDSVGTDTHREVARRAVQKSLVLLKNEHHTLPIEKAAPRIYIAGQAANDIGLQCGGWTINWEGGTGDITSGSTLLEGIRRIIKDGCDLRYEASGAFADDLPIAEIGLVVIAEQGYAEGSGDREDLLLSPKDASLISTLRMKCHRLVLVLYSGRPLIVTDELELCDAFVAAWLPGTEGDAIADVLFGEVPFTGKLPYAWPRSMEQVPQSALVSSDEPPLFAYGYGLHTSSPLV